MQSAKLTIAGVNNIHKKSSGNEQKKTDKI